MAVGDYVSWALGGWWMLDAANNPVVGDYVSLALGGWLKATAAGRPLEPLATRPVTRPGDTLQHIAQRAHDDFARGRHQLRVTSGPPTTDTLDKGQSILYESGGTLRVYYNVNGTIAYAALTAV